MQYMVAGSLLTDLLGVVCEPALSKIMNKPIHIKPPRSSEFTVFARNIRSGDRPSLRPTREHFLIDSQKL